MDELHSSIFFLSNTGFHYYLPAYMFFSVLDSDDWERVNNQLKGVYADGTPQRKFYERISGFNVTQLKIFRLYLEYIAENFESDYPDNELGVA